MVWSKMKQQLESFLCLELVGRVEYRATSYRYLPDKTGQITEEAVAALVICPFFTGVN